MDGLARDPDRLTTPHNTDTGETILHLLAKVSRKWLQNFADFIFQTISYNSNSTMNIIFVIISATTMIC